MWRLLAVTLLFACFGCSTRQNASLSQTDDFMFQTNGDFFSNAGMGGDPQVGSNNSK
jgi:hypothetical protein